MREDRYELVFNGAGGCTLTDHEDEVIWTSDADEEFKEEFDDVVTPDNADDIIAWLCEEGYIPSGAEVSVIDELNDDTGSWLIDDELDIEADEDEEGDDDETEH